MTKEDTDVVPGVPACFFFANSVPKTINGFKVCKACELTTGTGGIEGAQKLYGLWRIYCTSTKARNLLITKGITIDDQFIPIIGVNPKVVKGGNDNPAVKLIIGNIAKSVSNDEIEKALKTLEGVKIRSKMYYEFYRDEEGNLSLFKSGRRFIYIDSPPKPLPTQLKVGDWTPSLYHYGQKPKHDKNKPNLVLENNQVETSVEENPGVTHTSSVSELPSEPKHNGSQTATPGCSKQQTNLDKYLAKSSPISTSPDRQSRPKTRIPFKKGRTHSDSASRKRGLNVQDFQLAPVSKNQCTEALKTFDYFDFTPQFEADHSGTSEGSTV